MAEAVEKDEKIKAEAPKADTAETAKPVKAQSGKDAPAAKKAKPSPKPAAKARKSAPKTSAKAKKKPKAKPTPEKGTVTMSKTAEKTMESAQKVTEEATARMETMVADMNDRVKGAADKAVKMTGEMVEFYKGNMEAVIESGKIAAKGFQDIGQDNAAYARKNFEATSAAVKELASVKSPTEFFQMQSESARKGIDTLASQTAKNAEAWLKLYGEMAQPISNRISVASDTLRTAA